MVSVALNGVGAILGLDPDEIDDGHPSWSLVEMYVSAFS